MDIAATVDELRQRLAAGGDPASARAQQAYLKTELSLHGVNAAFLRERARALVRDHPGLDAGQRRELVEALWRTPFHDLRSLGIAILEASARHLERQELELVESLLERSRDWAHVDYLATRVAAPLVTRFPEAHRDLERWARADSFWLRRASLLALMPELRAGRGDLELLERLAVPMLGDREWFLRKAVGWVLREVAKKRPEWVVGLLERHLPQVSALTLREASRRLPAVTRDDLLARRRALAARLTASRRRPEKRPTSAVR